MTDHESDTLQCPENNRTTMVEFRWIPGCEDVEEVSITELMQPREEMILEETVQRVVAIDDTITG